MLLIVEVPCHFRRVGAAYAFYPTYDSVDVQDWCLINYNNHLWVDPHMPTGLKQSSSVVAIGFQVTETAPNTFTQTSIDLNLSPLDREVFVVLSVQADPSSPDAIAATDTGVNGSVTTTSQTALVNLANSNCLAFAGNAIKAAGFVDGGVAFTAGILETPPATLDYIGIIATNDFFVSVQGTNNAGAKSMSGKMYGYRAVASADIYAALVQSEVLSA